MSTDAVDVSTSDELAGLRRDVEAAELRAQAAYWKTAERAISASYGGAGVGSVQGVSTSEAMPSRLDSPWPRGEIYAQEARQQEFEGLKSLRDRACHLENENWLAYGVLSRAVENVVGAAIRIEPRTRDKEFNKRVRDRWNAWAHSNECDVRGEHTLGSALRLVQRMKLRDGDCGVVKTFKVDEQGRRQPKIQIIEPHRIENPPWAFSGVFSRLPQYNATGYGGGTYGMTGYYPTVGPDTPGTTYPAGGGAMSMSGAQLYTGNQVVDGVELDAFGQPLGFHVRYTDLTRSVRWLKVDARNFLFLKHSTRYTNVRGESVFRGGFTLFDQIMGYLDAVVVAARVGASQAMIRKTKSPSQLLGALRTQTVGVPPGTGGVAGGGGGIASMVERMMGIQPGAINVISNDDDLIPFNPAQPQQQMPEALRAFCRILGTKFGITLEQVLLDFSQTSYSSGKQANNQAKVTAGVEQEDLVATVVSPIYRWFVTLLLESGEVAPPDGGEDPYAHEWIPPARPSPEPARDAQAAKEWLALGLDCRSNLALENGLVFEEVCEQNARDRQIMAENGLPIDDDGTGGTPAVTDSAAGDVAFKREVLTSLLSVPAAREALFNSMDIEDLVAATGLPPEEGYQAPYIPVVAPSGSLVSGATIQDPSGDIVGGDIENSLPAATQGRNGDPGAAGDGGGGLATEAKNLVKEDQNQAGEQKDNPDNAPDVVG